MGLRNFSLIEGGGQGTSDEVNVGHAMLSQLVQRALFVADLGHRPAESYLDGADMTSKTDVPDCILEDIGLRATVLAFTPRQTETTDN